MTLTTSLSAPWSGPYGGLPPFDTATPLAIESATLAALESKRGEIARIVDNPAPADFENTIAALEDAGRPLKRVASLAAILFSTRNLDGMAQVEQRLAPLREALEDEIAHDPALFARIEAVAGDTSLKPEQARLVEVIRNRYARRGALLSPETRTAVATINGRISALQSRCLANMMADAAERYVLVETEAELAGLPGEAVAAASRLATEKGHEGKFAIANTRPAIWPVLQLCGNRGIRKQARDMWMTRCAIDGPHDNRPLLSELVTLRGEKAQLLGHESYAHYAIDGKMAGTPEVALAQLVKTLGPVRRNALTRLDTIQMLADAEGLGDRVRAWDWLFYLDKHRKAQFGLDAEAVKPYLSLENVLAMIFSAAGRLHGLAFTALPHAPRVHPDVMVYEVARDGEAIGVVWMDLLYREGKMRGSWQAEIQPAENFRGRRLCFSNVCSNIEKPASEVPILMGWEYANVLFHEFGHAMHMLMSRARYPSLGPMGVEWDLVELPSQLNERWLYDRELLRRHARHWQTGEPIPEAMINAIETAFRFDRVFSVGLEYLVPTLVDFRMHLAARGAPVDPLAIERETYAEFDIPDAIDPIFFLPQQYHSFTDVYAGALYSYLWADVMVADVIAAFEAAPGGLYDADVAARWRDMILSAGTSIPGAQAFRNFRGRDPDPEALLRRFELA
ncbi:MAG: M3 family metallopeptidase [Novosphingobium sp.]|nr:M3 family metallopeptidase [Novosphingobium sp.]